MRIIPKKKVFKTTPDSTAQQEVFQCQVALTSDISLTTLILKAASIDKQRNIFQ